MKVEKPFTVPEIEPVVSDALAEFITNYLPGTDRIHVLVYAKGGWSKANGIMPEPGDDPSDVYTMVKSCADHHCEEHGGESRRYRALMWRTNPENGKKERRTLSFEVLDEHEQREPEQAESVESLGKQVDGWQALCEEMRRMTAMAIEFSHRSVDRVLEQAKQESERERPMTDLSREMLAHYREGLRMQAAAVKEVGEVRVQQQIAQVQAQNGGKDSEKFWEVFAPAMQIAVLQAQQRLMGGRPPAKAIAPAPQIQRREHQPPPSAPPVAPPISIVPPPAAAAPTGPAASTAPTGQELPETLLGLSQIVLDNLGASTLIRLLRNLDEDQGQHLDALSRAATDDEAAASIVGLIQALKADPQGLARLGSLLTPPQLGVFLQLAELANRHMQESESAKGEKETSDTQAG